MQKNPVLFTGDFQTPLLTLEDAPETLDYIRENCGIPCIMDENKLVFAGANAMDLLGEVFGVNSCYMATFEQQLYEVTASAPKCKVALVDTRAVMPHKWRASDVGYDLVVIDQHKVLNETVTLYKTGVKIQPSSGWYAEIVPRSSLSKSGYMLANSIGIIDNSYTGELLVALAKVDANSPPIKFPFRGVQLIFRKQAYMQMVCVKEEDLCTTARASGGFGSTN